MRTIKHWTMGIVMTMVVCGVGCRGEGLEGAWQQELSLSAETLQAADAAALVVPQRVIEAENLLVAASAWENTACAAVETFYPDGYLTVTFDEACTEAEYGLAVGGLLTATYLDGALVLETTELWVEAVALEGSITAERGEVRVDLRSDDSELTLLLAFGAGQGLTVSGAVDDGNLAADIQDVHWAPGSCYPDGGTIVIDRRRDDVVVEFSAETADSGTVLVNGEEDQLPVYGDCP